MRSIAIELAHERNAMASGDIVQLDCNRECNFMLTNDENYLAYKQGRPFDFLGGSFKKFPIQIAAPSIGDWIAVVDVHDVTIPIEYTFKLIKRITARL